MSTLMSRNPEYIGPSPMLAMDVGREQSSKRVAIACTNCRQKRMRCDGQEPSCAPCSRKALVCEYQHGDNRRRPPSKRLVESLQARILVLETQVATQQALLQTRDLQSSQAVKSDSSEDRAHPDNQNDDEKEHPVSDITSHTWDSLLDQVTDRLGSFKVDSDGQVRFFSSQSNFNLVQEESGLLDANRCILTWTPGITLSYELQEHLVDLYFRWQNPSIYMVEKQAFMQDFLSGDRTRYCTPLLLLSIFALAARFSDRPELRTVPDDPDTAGDMFADQAKVLVPRELETASVATVQATALLSIRWMAENKEPAGWLYIGIATRMAFNLGLNLDSTSLFQSGMITEEELTVRKVTWWGCYILDKLFCLGLGRIATTADMHITCPKPDLTMDAEFEPWRATDDREEHRLAPHSRIVSLQHYNSDMLNIATKTLDIIYAPNHGRSKAALEALVSEADVALENLRASLPSYLRIPNCAKNLTPPHIYQFHIQYHVAQILLHRPWVGTRDWKRNDHEDDEHWKFCRKSASEIVSILRCYERQYSLRIITVGTVIHTFKASVVHLMDCLSHDAEIRRHGIQQLNYCLAALKEMATPWSWSQRVYNGLHTLAKAWLADKDEACMRNNQDRSGAYSDTIVCQGSQEQQKGQSLAVSEEPFLSNRNHFNDFTWLDHMFESTNPNDETLAGLWQPQMLPDLDKWLITL